MKNRGVTGVLTPNGDNGQCLIHSGCLIHWRKHIYWLYSFDRYWVLIADEAIKAER